MEAAFPYPVLIKPGNMGSSGGVVKVHDAGEFVHGMDEAARGPHANLLHLPLPAGASAASPAPRAACDGAGHRRRRSRQQQEAVGEEGENGAVGSSEPHINNHEGQEGSLCCRKKLPN